MEENKDAKQGIFDLGRYSEKTRKVIFGVAVGILLAIMAVAMFVISPKNDAQIEADLKDETATQAPVDATQAPVDATQAPVDDESTTDENSVPSNREEAITPQEDLEMTEGELPLTAEEEADKAQAKIIEDSLKRQKEQTDKVVEDFHPVVKDARKLQDIASKGMLEYCTDNPDETKEEKQARMKPYFHPTSSEYKSPSSLFFLTKCSVQAVTEPSEDEDEKIVVNVGMAWGGQYEKEGSADTGYTQYRVIVDKDGIVSFDD